MVSGSYYVQTGSFTPDIFWLALPVGCTVTAILASNNIRDMEEDRRSKNAPLLLFLDAELPGGNTCF